MSVGRKPVFESEFHGGDIADARAHGVPVEAAARDKDWLDLSTGINPNAYPVPRLTGGVWARLPGCSELSELMAAAAACYGAPGIAHMVAGAGSQALIQVLPSCLPDFPVQVLAPAYTGFTHAWREVSECRSLEDCDPAGLTILVNPNNPDGRVIPADEISRFAERCTEAGGWLVADEAFGDLEPTQSVAARCGQDNLIVLRSLGKFFGLAGLRLGFAIAPERHAERLRRALGPWAVSGPAIELGTRALNDFAWQAAQRSVLRKASARLDALLEQAGLVEQGGTALFRLVQTRHAKPLFTHFLAHKIYVRRFDDHNEWLRFGLPGNEENWNRLRHALTSFSP